MTATIYACYGVLGHEKEVFYWTNPIGDICDKISVEIPESMLPYEAEYGGIVVFVPVPGSSTRVPVLLGDILTSTKDGEPALKLIGWCYELKRVED